jgi:hypothetical protein
MHVGNECIFSHILKLGTRYRICCQTYAPAAFPLGKEAPVTIEYKAVRNQNQTGRCREAKYHLLLLGIETLLLLTSTS